MTKKIGATTRKKSKKTSGTVRPRHILIAGTRSHSIGRVIGESLREAGWEVWLYSRHARRIDKDGWHERRADISNERDVKRLIKQMSRVDACVFSADSDGHGTLQELSARKIKDFVAAKITGSLLLIKALESQKTARHIKCIWLAGRLGVKSADLALYAAINGFVVQLVNQINATIKKIKAYVLPLGVISPSTLGDRYIKNHPGEKLVTDDPNSVAKAVLDILEGGGEPGIAPRDQSKMV